jgi:hypothetical protein
MLLEHPDLFREAQELRFFDYYSEGSRGRHFTTAPGLQVSRDEIDLHAFEEDMCKFFRARDGSGACCHVEFTERRNEGAIQITVYVQGLPHTQAEFVNRGFERRTSHPAIEAAIVYQPADGHVATVAKGGKDVHETLREAFARKLLKVEPKFDAVVKRSFNLDALVTRAALPADASLGVETARVRKLTLAPRQIGTGMLSLQAAAGTPETSVYELGDRWFAEGSRLFERFTVMQATITMHYHAAPNAKRRKTINLELARPNTSNLKQLAEADRAVAEAHIRSWNLVSPAS